MLKLVNITKTYDVGDNESVHALRGIDIEFRKNEFVSILGQSGCGKTTLLNIIGGLDRYTEGDLIIEGRSTKEYRDRDWDTYRNHSIGFVFQTYNLIPHQSVLANVELALTLSGVSKQERRKKAIAALEKVGLRDQINKKPNQMSGGQMQRVAIARALINDPEILLADEPTGALDSETSVQIMDLLKEVANDRLVIMVTHNPELAEKYSTRIIRLLDGKIIDDSDPYASTEESDAVNTATEAPKKGKKAKAKKQKATSMSFLTALALSFNNLLTKKGRTFMTSFAGSIGIIGIALILSLSSGFQAYIDKVQEDTLSSYPITINAEESDMSALFESMAQNEMERNNRENDKVYANTDMYDMMNAMFNSETKQNDLKGFKAWIESGQSDLPDYATAIQYGYATKLDVYVSDTAKGVLHANDYMALFGDIAGEGGASSPMGMMSNMPVSNSINIFSEMIKGQNGEIINDLIRSQYELVDNNTMDWPKNKNQVLLVVNEYNEISESFLYALGLLDRDKLGNVWRKIMMGEKVEENVEIDTNWTYEDLIGMKFKLVIPTDKFQGADTDGDGKNDIWTDRSADESFMKLLLASGEDLEVVGIIRPKEGAVSTALQNTAVAYTSELTDWYLAKIADSEIVKYQKEKPSVDVMNGLPFLTVTPETDEKKAADFKAWAEGLSNAKKVEVFTHISGTPDQKTLASLVATEIAKYPDRAAQEGFLKAASAQSGGTMTEEEIDSMLKSVSDEQLADLVKNTLTEAVKTSYKQASAQQLAAMTPEQMVAAFDMQIASADSVAMASYYDLTKELRYSTATLKENLTKMGFSDKDDPAYVNIYAATFEDKDTIADIIEKYNKGKADEDKISYTDYVALMMSSVSTIINIISYVLIAFVSISLVVSSIMIGIITYISVLERTKEIGILRSIGASKKDISRVFNAETLIVGFVSGALGILVTVLLNIPISLIIEHFADIKGLAALPLGGGIILVIISMTLTLISGLIPSRVAAKKDPVVALRTE